MPDEAQDRPAPIEPDLGAEADRTTVTPAPPATPEDPGYTAAGVPTFDSVREKIETRYGTAIGATELASDTPQGRTVEEQYEARQQAAHDRLEQIKASMHSEHPPNGTADSG